jgi:hypothetical protein
MRDDKRRTDVDDLVRRVLADDAPPEALRGMASVLRRFHEARGRDAAAAGREGEGGRPAFPWLRPEWRWGRRALAFASLLLVVLGGTLHLAGPRSALADSLFSLNTLVSVSKQVRLAEAMDAAVRAEGPDGSPLDYVIAWRAPGTSRVEIRSGGRLLEVLTASLDGVAVEDRISGLRLERPALADVQDSLLESVLWLATPGSIAERIDSRWIPWGGRAPGENGTGAWTLSDPEGRLTVRMLVDPETLRPVEIVLLRAGESTAGGAGGALLAARFVWNDSATGEEAR